MAHDAVHREVCELCWALCDGALDEQGCQRLESLVRDDPEARRTYVQFMFLRGGLLWDKAAAGSHAPIGCPAPTAATNPTAVPMPTAAPALATSRRPRATRTLTWVATLAAGLLLATALWNWLPPRQGSVVLAASEPSVVLTREFQSRWAGRGQRHVGQSISSGRYMLVEGLVELQLGSGARAIVEGPAVFDVVSVERIGLQSDKIALEVSGASLRVDTPLAVIYDVGTSFAVRSGDDGVDVHVVEGLVEVHPRHEGVEAAQGLRVTAGEAAEIRAGDTTVRQGVAHAEQFAWSVPSAAQADPNLLAYEGFAYRGPMLAAGDGGFGWVRGWAGFDDLSRPSTALLVDNASLASEGLRLATRGGHVAEDVNDWGYRELAHPLDLDRNQAYYVSFLFRKLNPGLPGQGRWAGLSLFEGPSERVFFGTQDGGFRIAQLGHPTEAGRLEAGDTYFVIAKVAASANEPDQAFLKAYGPGEPLDAREPQSWTVTGTRDTQLHGLLDRVRIASESGYEIDELRVGLTWEAVTGPASDTTREEAQN